MTRFEVDEYYFIVMCFMHYCNGMNGCGTGIIRFCGQLQSNNSSIRRAILAICYAFEAGDYHAYVSH